MRETCNEEKETKETSCAITREECSKSDKTSWKIRECHKRLRKARSCSGCEKAFFRERISRNILCNTMCLT